MSTRRQIYVLSTGNNSFPIFLAILCCLLSLLINFEFQYYHINYIFHVDNANSHINKDNVIRYLYLRCCRHSAKTYVKGSKAIKTVCFIFNFITLVND